MPNYKTLRLIILVGLLFSILVAYKYIMPSTNTIKTFADCASMKGSKILQTDPAQCITKDGIVITENLNPNTIDDTDHGIAP